MKKILVVLSAIAAVFLAACGGNSHIDEALEDNRHNLGDVSADYLREIVGLACDAFNETESELEEHMVRAGVVLTVNQDLAGSIHLSDGSPVVDSAMDVVLAGILDDCSDYHWEPNTD